MGTRVHSAHPSTFRFLPVFFGPEQFLLLVTCWDEQQQVEFLRRFHDDPAWHARAADLAARTHELSDFLVNVLGKEDVGARFEGRVTYHLACHLRGLGLSSEPERLLRQVRGLELVPLERADECSGFGGSR